MPTEAASPVTEHVSEADQQNLKKSSRSIGYGLLWAFFLFVIGLLPRLSHLTYHSLWLDEVISIGWARLPARMIVSTGLELVQDKHPPLYYLVLHYWIRLFGEGEVSVRFLSALIGAIAIPLGYLLMRELYGHRAGVAAGLLLAFNPFLVWYSQEVRMFGLATTLLLAASLTLVGALQRFSGWHRWIIYVVLAAASFYTYLFSALVLAAHGVYVLLCWLRCRPVRHKTTTILIVFGALGLICAPLAWQAWQVGTSEALSGSPFGNLPDQFHNLLRAFVTWKAPWQDPTTWAVVAILGIMALWGALVGLLSDRRRRGPSFVAVYLLVPWLLGNLLLFFDRTVFDEARYFIFSAPAVCLALARPVGAREWRIRNIGLINVLLALIVFVLALQHLWTPDARREEWRAAALYLETHAAPDDVILVHADYAHEPFLYYYQGHAEVVYPFTGAIESAEQLTPMLNELAKRPAVWLVRSHWEVPDPQGLLEQWFAHRYPIITEQFPPGVTVKGYATGYRSDTLPDEATPMDAVFERSLHLVGCQIDSNRLRAQDDLYHPPSSWVHVSLYWEALTPSSPAHEPVVRVTDNLGQIWGDRLDRPAGTMRMVPPEQWRPGEIIRDDYDINLNPITPPGSYRVEIGLQSPSGNLIPVTWNEETTDRVVCGHIEIVP
jgi:mannosyltransferase